MHSFDADTVRHALCTVGHAQPRGPKHRFEHLDSAPDVQSRPLQISGKCTAPRGKPPHWDTEAQLRRSAREVAEKSRGTWFECCRNNFQLLCTPASAKNDQGDRDYSNSEKMTLAGAPVSCYYSFHVAQSLGDITFSTGEVYSCLRYTG